MNSAILLGPNDMVATRIGPARKCSGRTLIQRGMGVWVGAALPAAHSDPCDREQDARSDSEKLYPKLLPFKAFLMNS